MVDEGKRTTHQDDVVFSARYLEVNAWFSLLMLCAFPMWAFFRASYLELLQGRYVQASLVSIAPLFGLWITLDSLLFKELLFYQDRVVKVWYLFGQRTIYYTQAKVIGPPRGYKWLTSAHQIRETRAGKRFVIQIPILYIAFLFHANTAKTIGNILDYLTEDTENNPRPFRKARLPKEVVCQ